MKIKFETDEEPESFNAVDALLSGSSSKNTNNDYLTSPTISPNLSDSQTKSSNVGSRRANPICSLSQIANPTCSPNRIAGGSFAPNSDCTPTALLLGNTINQTTFSTTAQIILKCPLCPYETQYYVVLKEHVSQIHGSVLHDTFGVSGTEHTRENDNNDNMTQNALEQTFFDRNIITRSNHQVSVPSSSHALPNEDYSDICLNVEWCRFKIPDMPYGVHCNACDFSPTNEKSLQMHISNGDHEIHMTPVKHDAWLATVMRTEKCRVAIKIFIPSSDYVQFCECPKMRDLRLVDVEPNSFWHYQKETDSVNPVTAIRYEELRFRHSYKKKLANRVSRGEQTAANNDKDLNEEVQQLCQRILEQTREKRLAFSTYDSGPAARLLSELSTKNKTEQSVNNPSVPESSDQAEHSSSHTLTSFKLDWLPTNEPYSCPLCSYSNAKRYMVIRHMRKHSDEKPFACTLCQRKFKSPLSLRSHINVHTGTKSCPVCDACFTSSYEVVRHIRYKHTLEKPHKCSFCDYASVELSKLKRHVRSHTQERPFPCLECSSEFQDMDALKRHMRIHTGDKPYECIECGRRFAQSDALKKHLKHHRQLVTQHGGSHRCAQCTACFLSPGHLARHTREMHLVLSKPITCPHCSAMFATLYDIRVHERAVHGWTEFESGAGSSTGTGERPATVLRTKNVSGFVFCDEDDIELSSAEQPHAYGFVGGPALGRKRIRSCGSPDPVVLRRITNFPVRSCRSADVLSRDVARDDWPEADRSCKSAELVVAFSAIDSNDVSIIKEIVDETHFSNRLHVVSYDESNVDKSLESTRDESNAIMLSSNNDAQPVKRFIISRSNHQVSVPSSSHALPNGDYSDVCLNVEWCRFKIPDMPYRLHCNACDFSPTNEKFLQMHISNGDHEIHMTPVKNDACLPTVVTTGKCPVAIKIFIQSSDYVQFCESPKMRDLRLVDVAPNSFWHYQKETDSVNPVSAIRYEELRFRHGCEAFKTASSFTKECSLDSNANLSSPRATPVGQVSNNLAHLAMLVRVETAVDSVIRQAKEYCKINQVSEVAVAGSSDTCNQVVEKANMRQGGAGASDDSTIEIVWESENKNRQSAKIFCQLCAQKILAEPASVRNHMHLCHNLEGQILCREKEIIRTWWYMLMMNYYDEHVLMSTSDLFSTVGKRFDLKNFQQDGEQRNNDEDFVEAKPRLMPVAMPGIYLCPCCSYTNSFRFSVRRHIIIDCYAARNFVNKLSTTNPVPTMPNCSSLQVESNGVKSENVEILECSFCGFTDSRKDFLMQHFACCQPECKFILGNYDRNYYLYSYSLDTKSPTSSDSHAASEAQPSSEQPVILCLFCQAVYSHERSAKDHMITKHRSVIVRLVRDHDAHLGSSAAVWPSMNELCEKILPSNVPPVSVRGRPKTFYACSFCDLVSYWPAVLIKHTKARHQRLVNFEICRKSTNSDVMLKKLDDVVSSVAYDTQYRKRDVQSAGTDFNEERQKSNSTNSLEFIKLDSRAEPTTKVSDFLNYNEHDWTCMVQSVNTLISNISGNSQSQILDKEKTVALQNIIHDIQETVCVNETNQVMPRLGFTHCPD